MRIVQTSQHNLQQEELKSIMGMDESICLLIICMRTALKGLVYEI